MRFYLERQKEELKAKLVRIVQMLQNNCLPHADNAESRTFFLNLVGDFYRYQIELIRVEEYAALENLAPIQKKARRDRDALIQRANEAYSEAFKMGVAYLNPCNATRLSVALNYTIFLADFRRDRQKALTLSAIVQELALTRIDDSA